MALCLVGDNRVDGSLYQRVQLPWNGGKPSLSVFMFLAEGVLREKESVPIRASILLLSSGLSVG